MQGSPMRPGRAQFNQSPGGSSPTRFGSPGRRGYGGGSEADTLTTKTGGASNMRSGGIFGDQAGAFGGQIGTFGGPIIPGGALEKASIAGGGPGAALASLIGGSPDRKSGLSMMNPSLRKMN